VCCRLESKKRDPKTNKAIRTYVRRAKAMDAAIARVKKAQIEKEEEKAKK